MDDRDDATRDDAPTVPGAHQASDGSDGFGPAIPDSPLPQYKPRGPQYMPPPPPYSRVTPAGSPPPGRPPPPYGDATAYGDATRVSKAPPPPYGQAQADQPTIPSYWQEVPPDAGGWGSTSYYGGAASLGAHRPRRRVALAGFAALFGAVCVAVSLVVVLGGGTNAEAAVINAVNSTMANKTAHTTFTGTVVSDGQPITITGTGDLDFAQSAVDLNVTGNAAGQQINMEELFLGGTMYMQIPGLSQVEQGKSWISVDLSALTKSAGGGSTSALGSGGNPAANLQLLAQEGNTVTPLGSSTVDNVAVQGYAVTVNPAVIQSKINQDNLPSWMRQALSNVNFRATSFKVFIDGQGLLRRESITMQESNSGHTISVSETMDFSDYGAPVTIQAPPSDQVVDFSQFLQDVAGSGS